MSSIVLLVRLVRVRQRVVMPVRGARSGSRRRPRRCRRGSRIRAVVARTGASSRTDSIGVLMKKFSLVRSHPSEKPRNSAQSRLILGLVRTAAVEGLADVVRSRSRPSVSAATTSCSCGLRRTARGGSRDDPGRAVLGGEVTAYKTMTSSCGTSTVGTASRSVGIGGWIHAVSSRWRYCTVSSARISISSPCSTGRGGMTEGGSGQPSRAPAGVAAARRTPSTCPGGRRSGASCAP